MHIIANRAELLTAARRASAITSAGAVLDILSGVLLETSAGADKLTMTATNMEISLEQKVPCKTAGEDALVVRAGLFAGMLEKLPGEQVELRRAAGSPRLFLRGGPTIYELSVWERGSFPKIEIPFPEDTVKVTGVQTMARRTVFATVENKDKPMLRCVKLMFTRDGLRCAGSNGECVVTAKGDAKSTGDVNLLLPASSLDRLAHICAPTDEFQVGATGTAIVFMKENFTYSARLMDGGYIDTDRLIGMIKNEFTVLTDVQELRAALGMVRSVDPDGKVMLSVQGTKLTFQCRGVYGRASADIEVAPLTGAAAGEHWYRSSQLDNCLKALTGTVTLGVAQGGMLTLATEDAFYMQTGMLPAVEKPAEKETAAAKPANKDTAKKKPASRKKPAKQAA